MTRAASPARVELAFLDAGPGGRPTHPPRWRMSPASAGLSPKGDDGDYPMTHDHNGPANPPWPMPHGSRTAVAAPCLYDDLVCGYVVDHDRETDTYRAWLHGEEVPVRPALVERAEAVADPSVPTFMEAALHLEHDPAARARAASISYGRRPVGGLN